MIIHSLPFSKKLKKNYKARHNMYGNKNPKPRASDFYLFSITCEDDDDHVEKFATSDQRSREFALILEAYIVGESQIRVDHHPEICYYVY